MNALGKQLTLYMTLMFALFLFVPNSALADSQCQVTYGGGEVCQGQTNLLTTYPTPTPIVQDNNSISIPMQTFPPAHKLPATGPSALGYLLIGLATIGGIMIRLLPL